MGYPVLLFWYLNVFNYFLVIEDIKDDLLSLHAWSGCDTTSAIFYKGKGSLVTTLRKSERMREISAINSNVWSSQNEVGEGSIEAFKILYGGKKDSTLSRLRFDFCHVYNFHEIKIVEYICKFFCCIMVLILI